MTQFTVIIPARYASSRLPGKPLADIAGKPMIQHVFEQAKQSGASRIIIATDNEQVATVAKNFGAEVCMTAGNAWRKWLKNWRFPTTKSL